ncbi:MAG: metallophosphoesterase [Akkermansiaceae bacterium]|nr:metallophosphoesterase [Akkermansiaceae bacterium]
MNRTKNTQNTTDLLWLSDLHLERASDETRKRFLERLRSTCCDAILITGDISTSEHLTHHLGEISDACDDRKVYYLLGNHDYFHGSIREVERTVIALSQDHRNLVPLGQGEIIELSPDTALVGHRGWFDGLAGAGEETWIESPDHQKIDDFKHLDRREFFERLRQLGEDSATYLRQVLPAALSRYRHVMIATHVPPFYQGVKYDGRDCRWERQPFFTNSAAGNTIVGILKRFPHRRITVHAGHSHSAANVRMSRNLSIQVAGAQPVKPAFNGLLQIN